MRHTLAFRRARPKGPPRPSDAPLDRADLSATLTRLRHHAPLFAGGISYGARQLSLAVAAGPSLCDALLLCSYPLHPPAKPHQLRTAHFPQLRTPALFVHGDRDPFGSIPAMHNALRLIPAPHHLEILPNAAHHWRSLNPAQIVEIFLSFASSLS